MAKLTLPHDDTDTVRYYKVLYWICNRDRDAAILLSLIYYRHNRYEDAITPEERSGTWNPKAPFDGWMLLTKEFWMDRLDMSRKAFDRAVEYLVSSGILNEAKRRIGSNGVSRYVKINSEMWSWIHSATSAGKEYDVDDDAYKPYKVVPCIIGRDEMGDPEYMGLDMYDPKVTTRKIKKGLRGCCKTQAVMAEK